ncbi:MAG: SH3 domain-containing protein [Xanthobacteraceae bacterium]|nr:SH3 domain-containing protein [Xanthobacteraceae bacterium]QYK46071.1 MAG: SH3 domain-containing protein [Xanthobacteraceae bacterium]
MKFYVKSALAAAAFLLAAGAAAEARPVLVTADLNVRVGPGTQHPSVGVIPGGSTAEVGRCFEGWCEIFWRGLRGYSSHAYLEGGGPTYVAPPPPVVYGPRPYYGPGPYYGPSPYYYGPRRYWRRW